MLSSLLGDVHPFVLALLVLAVGFSVKRTALNRRSRRFNPVGDAQKELTERLRDSRTQLNQHEVRLHEVARDAEAALQSKIAVLDQMVAAADDEIVRLEALLDEIRDIPSPRVTDDRDTLDEFSRSSGHADRVSTEPVVESDQFIRLLRQSGFNPAEIASSMNMPESVVRRILREEAADEDDDRMSEAA